MFNAALRPGIFVDLDALFDTRLATLDIIDPLLAANALKKGYLDREDDNFEYCPLELFTKLYKARDNEVLGRSLMTHVKDIVFDFTKEAITTFKSGKTGNIPNVYINVWPYKIDKDATMEILKPFYKAVDGQANIHVVNVKPNELTPDICKKNFSYVIKYDFMDWITELGQAHALQLDPMPEVTLIGPRLYPSGKPSEELLFEESRNKMEPYQCFEVYFAPYVKTELYISRLFSAKIPDEFIKSYITEIDNFLKIQAS